MSEELIHPLKPSYIRYFDGISKALVIFMIMLIFCVFAYLVGWRSMQAGTDTQNYVEYFSRAIDGHASARYEPGFQIFTQIIAAVAPFYEFYFLSIYIVITASMMLAMYISSFGRFYYYKSSLALALLLSSSWYVVATTNGLRQGMALSILYVALTLFAYNRKRLLPSFLVIVAITFHYSIILFVPFIFSFFLPLSVFAVLYATLAVGYSLNVWEQLLEVLVPSVYAEIISFGGEGGHWFGFQWDLFLYTVGWTAIYCFLYYLVKKGERERFVKALRIYMTLSLPYFVFGFGGFSNRYAFIAWFFLPILHHVWITSSNFTKTIKYLAFLVIMLFGIVKFYSFVSM